MQTSPLPSPVPLDAVVSDAAALRRQRVVAHRIGVLAPAAAAIALSATLVARAMGRSMAIGPVLLAACLFAALAVWMRARRRHPVADADAARVDADAGLSGALRSAHWFSRAPSTDVRTDATLVTTWIAFHVQRTVDRASAVTWTTVYPARRPLGSWAATAALVAGLVATLLWPAAARPHAAPRTAASASVPVPVTPALPPALVPRLMSAFQAMKAGSVPTRDELKAVEEALELARKNNTANQALSDLFDQTDMDAVERGDSDGIDEDALRDKVEDELGTGESRVAWAYEDAVSRATVKTSQEKQVKASADASGDAQGKMQPTGGEATTPGKITTAFEEAGGSKDAPMQFNARGLGSSGSPGDPSEPTAAATALNLAQALRREVIAADADAASRGLEGDTERRTTNAGRSEADAVAGEAGTAYDRGHADRPPLAPESRTTLIRDYFDRPPTATADGSARQP